MAVYIAEVQGAKSKFDAYKEQCVAAGIDLDWQPGMLKLEVPDDREIDPSNVIPGVDWQKQVGSRRVHVPQDAVSLDDIEW